MSDPLEKGQGGAVAHSGRVQSQVAGGVRAREGFTRHIEAASQSFSDAAIPVYQSLPDRFSEDFPRRDPDHWCQHIWDALLRAETRKLTPRVDSRTYEAALDAARRRFSETVKPLEPLYDEWSRLCRIDDEDAYEVPCDDGTVMSGAEIRRQYRKALRNWIVRWRKPLRREHNLDPRFVEGSYFEVDFYTYEHDRAPDEGEMDDSAGEEGLKRCGSTFVEPSGSSEKRRRWSGLSGSHGLTVGDGQFDALPPELEVRELRYRIPRRGQRTVCVTVAATLLDGRRFPKDDVARLYESRWEAETHFAELKTTLRMRKLRCKTEAGALKELAVYCLVYNLVRAVMARAAARQGTTPGRVSFIDALRWLLTAAPGEDVPQLVINRRRPGRHEPRARKDRGSGHPFMTRPRHELRRALRKPRLK